MEEAGPKRWSGHGCVYSPTCGGPGQKLFGFRYHPDHMRHILRRLQFSVQLPTRELSRADPDEEARWLGHEQGEMKKV
ncbi:MAG: winged helix-turn-helix domain-containing protein [Desulfomonilaceae bacterium]